MSRVLVDSGIKWIGSLPNTWSITTVNKIFYRRKEVNDVENPTVLSLARDGVKIRDISTNEGQLAESYDNYHKVYKDDLMINPMDLISGANCSLSEVEGVISPAYINLAKKGNIYPKYYDYFFKYQYWINAMFIHGKGVSFDNRWTLNWETMSSYKLPLPSFEEQKKIANYLDKQSAKIDEIIRDNNKEIELLNEYRLSEIEKSIFKGLNENEQYIECRKKWVGKMNSKYELIPIKYLKSKKKNAFVDGPFGSNLKSEHFIDNGDVYVIESGFISTGKFIFKDFKTISNEHFETIKRSECNEKDIIIAKIGASYGMCAELPYLDKKSVVSGNSLKITLDNNKILNEIFIKEMQIAKNKGGFLELVNETAQPALSLSGLNNFKLVVPPMEEQVIIVKEINRIETKIDEVIKYRRNIINSLEEYKRSLIYECVTGKREV